MSPRNILIVKTHAIGDVLMATPAFRALRLAHPEARITLLVGKWSYPVVRHNPHIDEFVVVDEKIFFAKKVVELFRLVRKLRARHFDYAVVLHPSPMLHLFSWLCGIPQRIGLQREKKSLFLTAGVMENGDHAFYYPNNFLELAALSGPRHNDCALEAPYGAEESKGFEMLASRVGLSLTEPYLLVAPGGARNPKETISARLWPLDHYRQLLQLVNERFPRLRIVLSGGPGDADLCSSLAKTTPAVIDLCAQTSLGELLVLADHADAVLCNDSSMLHIALARGKEVFGFFGPTGSATRVPPLPNAHALQAVLACAPCYRYAVFSGCDKGAECMRLITPNRAFAVLEPVLRIMTTSGQSAAL
jgi:lipopolysaccharide heptosyltransferase II